MVFEHICFTSILIKFLILLMLYLQIEAELEINNFALKSKVQELESQKQKFLDNLRACGINIPPSLCTPINHTAPSTCSPTSHLPPSLCSRVSPKPECFPSPPPRYIPQANTSTNTWPRALPSPSPSPSPSSSYSCLSESSNIAPSCSDQYCMPVEQQIPFRRYSAETFSISCPSPNKPPRRYSADVFMFATALPNTYSSSDDYDKNDNINEQTHVKHETDVNIGNFDFLSDDFLDFGNRAEVASDVYVQADIKNDIKVGNTTPPTATLIQLPDLPEFSESWIQIDDNLTSEYDSEYYKQSRDDMTSDHALHREQGQTQHSICCNDSLVDNFEGYFVPLIVDEAMVPDGTHDTDNVTVASPTFF